MRKLFTTTVMAAALFAGLSLASCGGESKKPLTEETGLAEWPETAKESKPWTRWWWQGSAVRESDITAQLEALAAAGIGGVEITPIYGIHGYEDRFIEFLSPEWVKMFVYTLKEAERLGLGVDLANASGWPFGGPWVDSEMASKNFQSVIYGGMKEGDKVTERIEYTQRPLVRTAAAGKRFTIEDIKEPVNANTNLQELALDQIRFEKKLPLITVTANKSGENGFSETVDLTSKVGEDGMLDWTAPAGDWTVIALFQGDHGKMVERAGPGGEGEVIDHFSAAALKKYLDKFDESLAGYDISYLRYYFNDSYEVDDAQGEANWTPEFFEEFKKQHGYDLKSHLPALLGLDNEDINKRIIYDYRATIDELLLRNYTKSWQAWAAKQGKGIRNQGHGSPANVLDLYAVSDIPEIEGNNPVGLKGAASAAHVTGKKYASSESATWLNEHFLSTLGDTKDAIDRFLLAGVNHVFYHGTAFSPQDAPWPGWLFYAAVHFTPVNSWWDDFGALNSYIARSQSVLQAGKPNNDILLYFNISDMWSKPGRSLLQHIESNVFSHVSMKDAGEFLTLNGYSWDAVTDRQTAELKVSDSNILTGGVEYQTILLPDCEYMPVETFEKILDMAKKGATVLVYKHLPSDVPGFADIEKKQAKMKSLKEKLSFVTENGVQTAKYGKGTIIIADDYAALMAASDVARETMYDMGLQCIRRLKDDGGRYYFIKNTSEATVKNWVPLSADAKTIAIYNPMDGAKGFGKVRQGDAGIQVYMELEPNQALIVETFAGEYEGGEYSFYTTTGDAVALNGEWNVSFVKGGPELPSTQSVKKLTSWTEFKGKGYESFSGTAEYTTTIPVLENKSEYYLLDLGDVRESAAVYINDEYVQTLFKAPFNVIVAESLLKGGDKLTVRVSNTMGNRIADLDKRGVEWRIFYNTNFPSRRPNNRGANGLFSAAEWSPRTAGLLGPVTLTPEKPLVIE